MSVPSTRGLSLKADYEFNTIEELLQDVRNGRMVLLVDDEDRENEGDLVLAADHVTPEAINFMAVEARGLICLSLSEAQIEQLQLPQMVREDQNHSPNKTAFTVSIEAALGVSTGISAQDRAHTIRVASHPSARRKDISMPGHIFPIRAQEGGVLKRAGHTEGSVDLARLAGLNPAAVICEIMNPDGTMARVKDLIVFAKKHNIKIGTIVDLIEYRLTREVLVEEVYAADLELNLYGSVKARVFKNKLDGVEHLVLQKGEIHKDEPTLVRVQLDSYTRDLFGLLKSGETNLSQALDKVMGAGSGVFLLLRGFNTPQSLTSEVKAMAGEIQAAEMDSRDYGLGAQILRSIGAQKIRLVSNKLDKKVGLRGFDLEIVDTVALNEETHETEDRSRHITLQ